MSRLPTPEEAKAKHKESIQLEVCQRDYELMEEHHPSLLGKIEVAVTDDGVKPSEIKRWVREIADEDSFVQRCINAARYIQAMLETVKG